MSGKPASSRSVSAGVPRGSRGLLLLLVPYFLVTFFTLVHHELWRDEADVWLSVRDSSLVSVVQRASHAGTPILWYLLVAPLARSSLPYWSMGLLHLLIAASAAFVFLLRAPLSTLTKTLFVFSYYMIFEYAVIARNYGISILILFVLATIYPQRFRRPLTYSFLLALLFQTNVHSLLLGGVLAAVYVDELWRRGHGRRRLALLLLVAGALITVAQLFPREGGQFDPLRAENRPRALIWAAQGMFFPTASAPVLSLFTTGFLVLVVLTLWRKRRLLYLLGAMFAVLFYLMIFKWSVPDGYRHFGLLLISVIFILWIEPSEPGSLDLRKKKWMTWIMNAGLASLCVIGAWACFQEIFFDFSGSRGMAEYLLENDLARKTIVAHRATATSAILPYLPKTRFWYAGIGEYGTYLRWDAWYAEGERVTYEQAATRARQRFGNDSLLLLNAPLLHPQRWCLRERYRTHQPIFAKVDETFYLYEHDSSSGCQPAER